MSSPRGRIADRDHEEAVVIVAQVRELAGQHIRSRESLSG